MGLMTRLRRFLRRQDGVAAVEFALVLPIMLLVYIGTVEASALITMDRRVQSVTGTLGDLVARSNTNISATTMRDYFRAASGVMTPYPADDLEQVVTQVRVNADRTTQVVWSRQYKEGVYGVGTKHAVGATVDLPSELIDVAVDGFVIVSETSYSNYKPLYGIVFDQAVTLYRENFYLPRFQGSITVN
jgi:Flp pilus assembly protein TadG